MADLAHALAPDRLTRSVWVVIDPRDVVSGERVSLPLRVSLRRVAAEPLVSASALYCFVDLNLVAAKYVVDVEPVGAGASVYFAAEREFSLKVPPVGGAPVDRNLVAVDLFPRPAYPFGDRGTLARGRLVRRSNGAALPGAGIRLLRDGADQGRRGRTDERGDFVVFFPTEPAPESAPEPPATPPPLKFRLEFTVAGRPPHLIDEQAVAEGGTASLGTVKFPTL